MGRTKTLVWMVSVGLAVGCGDDDTQTSQTGGMTMTGPTTASTTESMTATTVDMTASSTATPTTSEGSGSMTSESSGTTVEPTTGMATATMGSSSTMGTTDVMTTDTSNTSTDSTTNDTNSTSTTNDTNSTSTTNDTNSTSSSTSTTDVSSTTEDIPCNELQVVLTPVVPNVMLVLDKSGSMLNTWDHDANPNTANVTRWFSLWAVVDQILTNFQAEFNFGMNLFPSKTATGNYDAGACVVSNNVEVTVKPNNKMAIMNALPAQNNMTIKGGTPAALGVTRARTHLNTLDAAIPRIIMLVTDGAANCGANLMPPPLFEQYDQTLHTIVGDAFNNDNIRTYVIGIAIANMTSGGAQDGNPDNTNPYDKLNDLATVGGTAKAGPEKFYSADNQIELAAALDAIISDAQSCVIALQAEPGFPEFTKVKIGNVEVPKIADCANQNGWKYVDPAPPYNAIELCGTACTDLKNTGEAGVEYYCKPG